MIVRADVGRRAVPLLHFHRGLRKLRQDALQPGQHHVGLGAHGQADIDLEHAAIRDHVDLQPAVEHAHVQGGARDHVGRALAHRHVERAAHVLALQVRLQRRRQGRLDRLHFGQAADQRGRDAGGAFAAMHVGAVRAGGQHLELQPQGALLGKADRVQAARLAVEHAVAAPARVVFQQPARTPAPARLLVGHRGQRHAARQLRTPRIQVGIGDHRGGGSRLHVAGAPAVQAAFLDIARPRVARPAMAIAHREHIHVAVIDQPRTGAPTLAFADHIGHALLGAKQLVRHAARAQEPLDHRRGGPRVARRIGRRRPHELLQEPDQHFALGLNGIEHGLLGHGLSHDVSKSI